MGANIFLAALAMLGTFYTAVPAMGQDAGTPVVYHATGLKLQPLSKYRRLPRTPLYRSFLPEKIDLTEKFPAPGDQGPQGSCVAWAVGYAARSYYAGVLEGRDIHRSSNLVSPAYIYDSIRDKDKDCAEGTYIMDALELLRHGAVSMQDYPYRARRCSRPPSSVVREASDFRIERWLAIDYSHLDQIKAELAQDFPVIIAMASRDGLQSLKRGQIYRARGTDARGFHAVTLVGYDERRQAFRAINSWGSKWGDKGYFWFAYDAFARDVKEAYSIRVADNGHKPLEKIPHPRPSPRPQPAPHGEIPTVACGHLSIGSGEHPALQGFVGHADDLEKARSFADREKLEFSVDLHPWPQCEAMLTLAEAKSSATPVIVGGASRTIHEAERMTVDLTTPPTDSYLYLSYIQADGNVLNLVGGEAALVQYRPGSRILLGDGADGRTAFTVRPPLGNEMLVAVSSRSPLFDEARPQVQTAREFLTVLRKAVMFGREGNVDKRAIGTAYQTILTVPN